MSFKFEPNGQRASLINLQMRTELANSLEYLKKELISSFTFQDINSFDSIVKGLKEAQDYPCLLFALYTELVLEITNSRYEKVESILNLISKQKPLYNKNLPSFVTLESKYFMNEEKLLAKLMNIEEGSDFKIVTANSSISEIFKKRLEKSLGIIEEFLPELFLEINSLVTQIIMVEPASDSESLFDGGSSYMLWGGLFLNAKSHNSEIALVEVLAHEASHLLLFGLEKDESLTLNLDSERFSSPLRDDKRPMEGIYHAMFASARMFWAMKSLLENKKDLSIEERIYIEKRIEKNLLAFNDAYNVVEEYAVLTNTGKKVLNESYFYMRNFLK